MNDIEITEKAVAHAKVIKKQLAKAMIDHLPKEEQAISVFMAGSPGAGKTETAKNIIAGFKERSNVNVVHIENDELRKEFEDYLAEAGDEEIIEKKKIEKEEKTEDAKNAINLFSDRNKYRKWGMLEPFMEMFAGFGELATSMTGNSDISKAKKDAMKGNPKARNEKKLIKALSDATRELNILYLVYKKAHRLLNW